jgi:hypothetical protein
MSYIEIRGKINRHCSKCAAVCVGMTYDLICVGMACNLSMFVIEMVEEGGS